MTAPERRTHRRLRILWIDLSDLWNRVLVAVLARGER